MSIYQEDIISINDLDKNKIDYILSKAKQIKNEKDSNFLSGIVSANLFFEPSTRTRLSFESAIALAGGHFIEITDPKSSSIQKGESFNDTIKMVEGYAHVIIIRHPHSGTARFASEIANIPVINAGDGTNQHPTQALQDMFTLKEHFDPIQDLTIGILGDLKYGRAVNSFIMALIHYGIKKLYLISPKSLKISDHILLLNNHNIDYTEVEAIEDVASKLDVLYVTRIQKERFEDLSEYSKVKSSYSISLEFVNKLNNKNLKIMHPFPRVDELKSDLDSNPNSLYFQQAHNGIFLRQALIGLIAGVIK